MSAVICLLVEVINIDLGTSFDFVTNNVLLSKIGKHGLGENGIKMQNLFSSSVVWHTGAGKDILNKA